MDSFQARSWKSGESCVFAFALIVAAITPAVGLLWGPRFIANALGSDIFDKFPLFPKAVIGGFVVQWLATKTGQGPRSTNRR